MNQIKISANQNNQRAITIFMATVFLFVVSGCSVNKENYSMYDLKVNDLTNPTGIDVQPTFQWKLNSDGQNVAQTAYQLIVNDDDGKEIWNSGKVNGDRTFGIAYDGPTLKSNGFYQWKVISFDNHNHQAESEWQSFSMGLLENGLWQANWIEATIVRKQKYVNQDKFAFQNASQEAIDPEKFLDAPLYFRKSFQTNKKIKRATAYASAHGVYNLYVNGKLVSEELAPGFTVYKDYLEYQQYDITKELSQNENVLGVILADGWWSGTWGIMGVGEQYGTTNALLCQVMMEYEDGSTEIIKTDENVKWNTGGFTYADLSEGVKFDANNEITGWMLSGFDDTDWKAVKVVNYGYANLKGRRAEPVRIVQSFHPKEIIHSPKGETIINVGQNIVGRLKYRLTGKKGQTVSFTHMEVLDKEGNFYKNILGIFKSQKDVYTFSEDGTFEFTPYFTFHGFQYVLVEGLENLNVNDFTVEVLATDMQRTGTFSSSDSNLTQLQQNIFRSQQSNMLSIPTDCPQREKAGWTGDMQVYVPTAMYNMDVKAFLSKWLTGLRYEQFPDGAVPDMCPRPGKNAEMFDNECAAGWGDAAVIVPYRMYQEYADKKILTDNYDMMKRWMNYIATQANGCLWNAGFQYGDWLVPKTPDKYKDKYSSIFDMAALSGPTVASAMYAYSTSLMIDIAKTLGKTDDVTLYTQQLQCIKEAFSNKYIAKDGMMEPDLQGVYVLALDLDLPSADKKEAVKGQLVANIHAGGNHLNTGFLSVPFLLDALYDKGHSDLAFKILMQDTEPSWLYEVKMGANTMWESWDNIAEDGTPKVASYNHFAFGCVGDFIYRRILGLQSSEPGYKSFVINPDYSSGLAQASGTHETVYGQISVEWEIKNNKTQLKVSVPVGTQATVYVDGKPVVVGSGKYNYEF